MGANSKLGIKRRNSYTKMKMSLDERHILISSINVCEHWERPLWMLKHISKFLCALLVYLFLTSGEKNYIIIYGNILNTVQHLLGIRNIIFKQNETKLLKHIPNLNKFTFFKKWFHWEDWRNSWWRKEWPPKNITR